RAIPWPESLQEEGDSIDPSGDSNRSDAAVIPITLRAGGPLAARLDGLAERGAAIDARLDALATDPSSLPPATLESINAALLALDRVWWDERGLFDRPWYRNLSIATDRFTGYGSTAMPIVAEPVADGDADRALEGLERLEAAIDRLEGVMVRLEELLEPRGTP
ncbi:MAG: transferrin receptor-like dimerization domain-containing protein, partial [Phycisphaerales bacterium]